VTKGIAINTIMLLIIGILVAGIVVYLIYRYASGRIISERDCQSRLTEVCVMCKNGDWSSWPNRGNPIDAPFFQLIDECSSYPKFSIFRCPAPCPAYCNQMNQTSACKIFGIE